MKQHRVPEVLLPPDDTQWFAEEYRHLDAVARGPNPPLDRKKLLPPLEAPLLDPLRRPPNSINELVAQTTDAPPQHDLVLPRPAEVAVVAVREELHPPLLEAAYELLGRAVPVDGPPYGPVRCRLLEDALLLEHRVVEVPELPPDAPRPQLEPQLAQTGLLLREERPHPKRKSPGEDVANAPLRLLAGRPQVRWPRAVLTPLRAPHVPGQVVRSVLALEHALHRLVAVGRVLHHPRPRLRRPHHQQVLEPEHPPV